MAPKNTDSPKTFEKEGFKVEATHEPGCRLSVKVTMDAAPVKKAYKKAVKAINKQISVPGFRKGRAPDATVISRYGSNVEQEWKEIVVNDALKMALELTDVYPYNKESLERPKIEKCEQEEGAVISLAYEHYPEIGEIDFASITLPEIEKAPITDARVDEVIAEIQQAHAAFESVTGRAAKEGDYVDVTIDSLDEDPPKNIVKDRRFEIAKDKMAPWLHKLLIGLDVEGTIEGKSEVDEKADENVKKNFKPTNVRITLHAIKKIIPPEFDDELAKKSGAESKEQLLERIRENLEKEGEEEFKQKQFEAFENALLEKYPIELPASLVSSEREERLRLKIQDLKGHGHSTEAISAREKELEAEVAKETDENLRLYFLNKQIAKQGEISLTNQELNDALIQQVSSNPMLYGKDMDEQTQRELVSRIASALMQRKAKEYALGQLKNA